MMTELLKSHYYFVDEAGQPEIWGRRQKDVLIGKGSSRFFIMGLADIREVSVLSNALDNIRTCLLNSPDISKIPSMAPAKRKTARQFHAKDDHPIVRERVFRLLCRREYDIRFYAVVRHKQAVLELIRRMESVDSSYRYQPNHLYDAMVRRLLSGRLHFNNSRYTVYFAQRSKSPRQNALRAALEKAQRDYEQLAGLPASNAAIRFISGYPCQYQGLQVVDYFCWALQRLFERRENHYWKSLWDAGKVRCVVDLDDVTEQWPKGQIYSQSNPLTGELRE